MVKRTVIGMIVAVLLLVGSVFAQNAAYYEKIAPGNTVTAFTSSLIAPTSGLYTGKKAIKALIYVKTNAVQYTTDGTTPTQTGGTDQGMYAPSGTWITITGHNDIANFRCIDATAGSASDLRVTYFFE